MLDILPTITRSTARSTAAAALLALTLVLNHSVSSAQAVLPFGFTDHLVCGGLSFPVGMAMLPDGRLFVVEQKSAKIRLIVNGALAAVDPVFTVPQVKINGPEQGLLAFPVAPDFPFRPYVNFLAADVGGSILVTATP